MPITLEHRKPQNRTPLLTDLEEESKGKEPRRAQAYIPHKIPKRKASKSLQENHQEKAPKITKRTNENNTSKPWGTTPNHLYIPKRFIQGLVCRPIILPSHKISPWTSQASPMEILRKIGKKWSRVPRDGCHPLTTWVIWRQPKV
jgi:hypothetical protein